MITAFTNLKPKNIEGILEFKPILFTVRVPLIKLTFSNLTPFQKLLLMSKVKCAKIMMFSLFPIFLALTSLYNMLDASLFSQRVIHKRHSSNHTLQHY